LFHVLLSIVGLPAIGEGFARILDLASLDRIAEHFHDALEEEGCVRVTLVALDEGIVACRLYLLHFLRHQTANADIVEGDVER